MSILGRKLAIRKTKLLYFSGRVQGVFFRANARTIAEELSLVGYARNLSDGRVECLVQGEQIDTFKSRLVQKFDVTRIEESDDTTNTGLVRFRIL